MTTIEKEEIQRKMCHVGFKEEVEFMDLPWVIICSILSRLPMKLIGQFMCVSKSFCDIKNDSYFVELHLRNSKFQPVSYILKEKPEFATEYPIENPDVQRSDPAKTLYLVTEGKEEMNMNMIPIIAEVQNEMLSLVGSFNGLLCFLRGKKDPLSESFVIYNPITQEYMQAPTVPGNVCQKYITSKVSISFAFDAISKKYKVVVICGHNRGGEGMEVYILTLGESFWRKSKLSFALEFEEFSLDKNKSILWNGSLCWIMNNNTGATSIRTILSMDISTEKFQEIYLNEPELQSLPTAWNHYFLLGSGKSLELAVHDYSDKQKRMNVWVLVDIKRGIWSLHSTHYLGCFLDYKKDPEKFLCKKIEMSDPDHYHCRMKKNAGGDSLLIKYDYFEASLRDTTYKLGPGLHHLVCYTPRERKFSIDFLSNTEIPDYFDVFVFYPSLVSLQF